MGLAVNQLFSYTAENTEIYLVEGDECLCLCNFNVL